MSYPEDWLTPIPPPDVPFVPVPKNPQKYSRSPAVVQDPAVVQENNPVESVDDDSRKGRWLDVLKPYLIEQKRRGRHEPNDVFRNQVIYFSGMGLTNEQMAVLLQISVGTLEKYYTEQLSVGMSIKNLAVAQTMHDIATDVEHRSSAQVGMWWLERRGGENWKPVAKKIEMEHTGTVGIQNRPIIDSSKLSFEQRQQLRDIILAVGSPEELQTPEELADGHALTAPEFKPEAPDDDIGEII